MNPSTLSTLEYPKIKQHLQSYAMSYLGRSYIEELAPLTEVARIERLLAETEEAKSMVLSSGSVPIPTLQGIGAILSRLGKGFLFNEQDFTYLMIFLRSTSQLKQYLRRKMELAPHISSFGESLYELKDLLSDLDRCIAHETLVDDASPELHKVRKKIVVMEERLKRKLDGVVQKYRIYLQDVLVIERNGRYVIPVKKEHRKRIAGTILDESSSGHTVFIEPAEILVLQSDLADLRMDEEKEKTRVLAALTEHVEHYAPEVRLNVDTIGYCDFVFAKARFAKSLDARAVKVNQKGRINICNARHPLLRPGSVPLNFSIGESYHALVITGPNTGGKTVSLKTVGLLTLMVQSGLLVPVDAGSEFAVFHNILADIGDGQSIEESLSTFSSHITNIVEVLASANAGTLILLDELATGTDPGEGVGLSIAILERLQQKGATIVATTHFNEIKQYASMTPGFENARMEFDVETLQPLYRLRIGEAGQSYAFLIAQKLGLSVEMIARAREMAARFAQPAAAPIVRPTGASSGQPVGQDHQAHARQTDLGLGPAPRQGPDRRLDRGRDAKPEARSKAEQEADPKSGLKPKPEFQVGDRVWIHHMKCSGIVYRTADERGNVIVLVKKEKITINRKRISLYVAREELYPEEYDLDIVLESKDVRRKRKIMSKRHVDGLSIELKD